MSKLKLTHITTTTSNPKHIEKVDDGYMSKLTLHDPILLKAAGERSYAMPLLVSRTKAQFTTRPNNGGPYLYDVPIRDRKHAEFCKREAKRRYGGRIIRDEYNMLLVEDKNGFRHTDDVLRALSFYRPVQVRIVRRPTLLDAAAE